MVVAPLAKSSRTEVESYGQPSLPDQFLSDGPIRLTQDRHRSHGGGEQIALAGIPANHADRGPQCQLVACLADGDLIGESQAVTGLGRRLEQLASRPMDLGRPPMLVVRF